MIAANGEAVFGSASIRGSISASSIDLNDHNYWRPQNLSQLPPVTSTFFKVGNNDKYVEWNGSTLTIKGTLSGVDGTFSGTLSSVGGIFTGSLSAASGTFGSYITAGSTQIGKNVRDAADHNGIALDSGSWNNAWVRRGDGSVYFRAGSSTKYIQIDTQFGATNEIVFPNFSVNNNGFITATGANITGTINAAGGTITGFLNAGGVDIGIMRPNSPYYKGINLSPDPATQFQSCFIKGAANEVFFRADNGSQWIKFENGEVDIKATNLTINNSGATFSGALSGATGSVGANFTIGNNLFVGNNMRINGPVASNVTVAKIKGDKNLGDSGSNGTFSLVIEGPNGTNKWELRDDGLMTYRTQTTYSDMRLKKNIENSNLGLQFIKDLKPVSFLRNLGKNSEGIEIFKNKKTYGFVAQQVKEVYEKYTDSFEGWDIEDENNYDSYQKISYDNFIAPIVKAIQELSTKVDELESRMV